MFKLKSRSHQADSFFCDAAVFSFCADCFYPRADWRKAIQVHCQCHELQLRGTHCHILSARKVRQNDSDAAISVETINGTKALCLKNTINDIVYNTFIYYYDGSLRELYVQDGSSYSLDSGQRIVEIGGLDMTETTDKMITVTITDTSGGTTDTYCSVNSD